MNEGDALANVTRILGASGLSPAEIEKATSVLPTSASGPLSRRGRIDGQPVNPYLNPTSVPDPNMKVAEGPYSIGFNLDGNENSGGFTDPQTGEKGVDNELFRVYGCTPSIRANPGSRSTWGSTIWAYTQPYMLAWLIEVSGIRDFKDSPNVEVRISQATSPVSLDAKGNVTSDMTFLEDANRLTTTRVRGEIKNGELTTDFMPHLNLNGDRYAWPEMRWTHARLRLKWKPDGSVAGIIAGYHNWGRLYASIIEEAWGWESVLAMDVPGLYYAFRKLADADPDPKSGLNTSISTAFMIEAVPAFIARTAVTQSSQLKRRPSRLTGTGTGVNGVLANPPGITIKVIHIGSGTNTLTSAGNQPRERIVFANETGQVLYTSDRDSDGKSECSDVCATTWVPAIAEAKPVGYWSIITRADGMPQWAFRGKALYTYGPEAEAPSEPTHPEEIETGVASDDDLAAEMVSERELLKKQRGSSAASTMAPKGGDGRGQDVDGHHVLEIRPEQWVELPSGIQVQEVRTAPGYILTDTHGLPLYSYKGKSVAGAGPKPGVEWIPFAAPQAAVPVGDFTILARGNGIYQWAYQGKPLYRFANDLDYGDASGEDADPDFQFVYVLHYFMPNDVTVLPNRRYGGLLASTGGGLLYSREVSNGASLPPRGDRGNPQFGAITGVSGCDSSCEQSWKPLLAPDDARPDGYWTVYKRPDGRKQWAYYGYALYSRATPGASTDLYDRHNDFEALPNGGVRNRLPMHWRLSPP
jgi:predicted lipoprotein with Yx(FWY)xxD motif